MKRTHRNGIGIPDGNELLRLGILFVPIAFLALFYGIPLSRLVMAGLSDARGLSFIHYQRLFGPESTFAPVLLKTFLVALKTTLICAVMGYLLAIFMSRLAPSARIVAMACVTVPFFTSILIRSYAWVAILGPNGVVNKTLLSLGLIDDRLPLVFNETGMLIGLVQVELPLMVLPLLISLRRIDTLLGQAARSLGAGPLGTFLQVTLPLSVPGLITGCAMVFITTLGSYVTPTMLGGEQNYLLAQAIELRVMSLMDFPAAAAQATILLLAVVSCTLVFRRYLDLGQARTDSRPRRTHMLLPAWLLRILGVLDGPVLAIQQPLLTLAGMLVLLQLVAPLVVIWMLAFSGAPFLTFPPPSYSMRWFIAYLSDPRWTAATWFSVWVSFVAATSALILGTCVVFALRKSAHFRSLGAAVTIVSVSPMILPHMVIAVSLYFYFAKMDLVGTPLGFVFAYTLLGLPFVVIVLGGATRRFDSLLEQAAASLGATRFGTFRQIIFPILLPSFVTAFALAFLAGFDDLVISIFLSSADAVTLPMRMWEDIVLEINPRIAAVAVLLFLAAAFLGLACKVTSLVRIQRRAH